LDGCCCVAWPGAWQCTSLPQDAGLVWPSWRPRPAPSRRWMTCPECSGGIEAGLHLKIGTGAVQPMYVKKGGPGMVAWLSYTENGLQGLSGLIRSTHLHSDGEEGRGTPYSSSCADTDPSPKVLPNCFSSSSTVSRDADQINCCRMYFGEMASSDA